ncbi:MAG TPA: glucose 1-dehydrogenase [Vicinamibacterales bacterium]|nr:glucose 1-dehydrogenase [Vicinamibacterales bacterium]
MRAITIEPGVPNSARLEIVPEPPSGGGEVLVRTLAVGVCGTDLDLVRGEFGTAPPGETRLILGHESLGEVVKAPPSSGFVPGQRVVGIVRRPDPVPCPYCASGEWDMCRNGQYTEHGIKGLHGFGADYFRMPARFLVPVDEALGTAAVLLEPTSIVAKAWEHIDRIAARTISRPQRVLVTGAGPIGLLAALLAAERGYAVHVLDRVTSGPKPQLAADLGAAYHTGPAREIAEEADIVVECTGAGEVIADVLEAHASSGIVCLTGVSSGARSIPVDLLALNRTLVLENTVIFGTVNANRRHYDAAAQALAEADPSWLARLITREVTPERWAEALERRPDDVKPIIRFA